MQVIPAVDVLGGRVVRLSRGRYDRVTTYANDPLRSCRRWSDEGAAMVHVVDLVGARSGRADPTLWERLGSAGIPFQVGGGIRSALAARRALDSGAARVVVGSVAIHQPATLAAIIDAAGPSRVVVALDVKEGRARGSGWLDRGESLETLVVTLAKAGAMRVLVTGIDRDGVMSGPDVSLLRRVERAAPDLLILASGGVGSLDDIVALERLGVEGVIIGRALYESRFTLAEADAAGSSAPAPR
jgi:phosphoribosylformimino-5-aminoimidazole carboxamide ribotide isomerase